jgi:hypothetical protein
MENSQSTRHLVPFAHFNLSQAPGEAEAELAYLNRIGVIDAVISDDVDNFLFGATTLIRKQVPFFPSCLPLTVSAAQVKPSRETAPISPSTLPANPQRPTPSSLHPTPSAPTLPSNSLEVA